jgi:hypothetical protein
MNAFVIMHNMMNASECGQDNNYLHYALMGCHVQVHMREERVVRFIDLYKAIRDDDVHDQLQEDLIED